MPTETYKSTTQHTTWGISHPRQCLFTRTTPRIQGSDHVGHWLFSLNSNSFTPLLWKLSVCFIFSTSSYPLWMYNPSLLLFPNALPCQSPRHPSSFAPSLSCLIISPSPPPTFPHCFSFFSTIVSVYPLHLPSKILLFLSSSVSGKGKYADLLFVEAVFAQTDTG